MTPKSISLIIISLPWSPNRISKPTSHKTKFIKYWPEPGPFLMFVLQEAETARSCFALGLNLLFWPCRHLFSYQGHRVSRWQRRGLNLGCLTANVLLFPPSQAPGNQECEQSFACSCVRASDKKKTNGVPERGIKDHSPPSSCSTPDCKAKQSSSQFDTNSKELCFPVSLVDNPFTEPWPLFTWSAWPQVTIETWRTRNSLSKYAYSTVLQLAT